MTRRRLIRVSILISAAGALAFGSGGCYKRVVDSRGLGADSTKLRSEYEREPVHYRKINETRRTDRDVRPARDR